MLLILHRAFLPSVTKMLVQMNQVEGEQTKPSGDVRVSDTSEGSNPPAPTCAGMEGAPANHGATHGLHRPLDEICEIPGVFVRGLVDAKLAVALMYPFVG